MLLKSKFFRAAQTKVTPVQTIARKLTKRSKYTERKSASAPAVRSVLKLTSVVDFRSSIEAIAALSQLTPLGIIILHQHCYMLAHERRDLWQKVANLHALERSLTEFAILAQFPAMTPR